MPLSISGAAARQLGARRARARETFPACCAASRCPAAQSPRQAETRCAIRNPAIAADLICSRGQNPQVRKSESTDAVTRIGMKYRSLAAPEAQLPTRRPSTAPPRRQEQNPATGGRKSPAQARQRRFSNEGELRQDL